MSLFHSLAQEWVLSQAKENMTIIHSLAREWVLSQAQGKHDINSFSGTRVGSVTGTRKI